MQTSSANNSYYSLYFVFYESVHVRRLILFKKIVLMKSNKSYKNLMNRKCNKICCELYFCTFFAESRFIAWKQGKSLDKVILVQLFANNRISTENKRTNKFIFRIRNNRIILITVLLETVNKTILIKTKSSTFYFQVLNLTSFVFCIH